MRARMVRRLRIEEGLLFIIYLMNIIVIKLLFIITI